MKKAPQDSPPSMVVNGEGEDDGALAESVHGADPEIVSESKEDDADGVVIDVEDQNADRNGASSSAAMEMNLVFFLRHFQTRS